MLSGGRSRSARGIVVHVRERDGGGQPRLGLVVPKAVGPAVVRNRMKRRLRAIWRALTPAAAIDCVIVVRPEAAKLTYRELAESVEACLRRAAQRPRTSVGVAR